MTSSANFSGKIIFCPVSVLTGRKKIHNAYRENSFAQVMRGVELLKKYGVAFNTLTAVNDVNSLEPETLYLFLRKVYSYMQFLPVVEFLPSDNEANDGQNFATPSGIYFSRDEKHITSFSVKPVQWGKFLCGIFTCGANMMPAKSTFS